MLDLLYPIYETARIWAERLLLRLRCRVFGHKWVWDSGDHSVGIDAYGMCERATSDWLLEGCDATPPHDVEYADDPSIGWEKEAGYH